MTVEAGLEGDLRGRPGRRQITILAREAWEQACAELGQALDWTVRRANLLVEGLDFADSTGSQLSIGPSVVLEITGETEPCRRMEIHSGLRAALAPGWRGGVTCRVVRGGLIRAGDPVVLRAPALAAPDEAEPARAPTA